MVSHTFPPSVNTLSLVQAERNFKMVFKPQNERKGGIVQWYQPSAHRDSLKLRASNTENIQSWAAASFHSFLWGFIYAGHHSWAWFMKGQAFGSMLACVSQIAHGSSLLQSKDALWKAPERKTSPWAACVCHLPRAPKCAGQVNKSVTSNNIFLQLRHPCGICHPSSVPLLFLE